MEFLVQEGEDEDKDIGALDEASQNSEKAPK